MITELFKRFHDITVAILVGMLIGSLRKIWPFQRDLTPDVEKLKLKRFVNEWPDAFDGAVLLTFGLMLVAAVFVLALNHFSNRGGSPGEGAVR